MIGSSDGKQYETEFEATAANYGISLNPLPDIPSPPTVPSPWPSPPQGPILAGDVIKGPRVLTPMDKALDDQQRYLDDKKNITPRGIVIPLSPIKKGEVQSDETPDAIQAGQQYAANEGKRTTFTTPGVEMQGGSRGGVGGGYSKGGDVSNLVERRQMKSTANENIQGKPQPLRPEQKGQEPWTSKDGNPWGMSDKDYMAWRKQNGAEAKQWERDNPTWRQDMMDRNFSKDQQQYMKAVDKQQARLEFQAVDKNYKPDEFTKEINQMQKAIIDLEKKYPKLLEPYMKEYSTQSAGEKFAFWATIGASIGGSALVGGMQLSGAFDEQRKLLKKAE